MQIMNLVAKRAKNDKVKEKRLNKKENFKFK